MSNHRYLHVKHIFFKLILIHEKLGYHYQMEQVCKGRKGHSCKMILYWFFLVNVQIFHDSVKNVYRILSIDGSKVLINTIVTARMSFTKTSQKFCQWVDSRANHVYGLGFANEPELTRVNDSHRILYWNIFIMINLVYG